MSRPASKMAQQHTIIISGPHDPALSKKSGAQEAPVLPSLVRESKPKRSSGDLAVLISRAHHDHQSSSSSKFFLGLYFFALKNGDACGFERAAVNDQAPHRRVERSSPQAAIPSSVLSAQAGTTADPRVFAELGQVCAPAP